MSADSVSAAAPPPVDHAEAERLASNPAALAAEIRNAAAVLHRVNDENAELRAALDAARAELAEMEDLAANLGAERLDALAEVERLRAQRDAALEIHRIYPAAPLAAPYCEECPSDLGWPCSTARALGAE